MGSIPSLSAREGALATIPGQVPLPENMPAGCRFATRCPFAEIRCHQHRPALRALANDHHVACFRAPLEQHVTLGESA
jgi:peptide/nickel transport system ATP-binding protein